MSNELLIARLRGLEQNATLGPWTMAYDSHAPSNGKQVAWVEDASDERVPRSIADATLIAEMRNALPVLLDALDIAEGAARNWMKVRDATVATSEYQENRRLVARVAELESDRLCALKRAYEFTLETQTLDEAVASLLEMIKTARYERDELDAQIHTNDTQARRELRLAKARIAELEKR